MYLFYVMHNAHRGILVIIFYYFLITATSPCEGGAVIGHMLLPGVPSFTQQIHFFVFVLGRVHLFPSQRLYYTHPIIVLFSCFVSTVVPFYIYTILKKEITLKETHPFRLKDNTINIFLLMLSGFKRNNLG